MEVRREVLRAVKTGTIEVVSDVVLTRIEFNCDCLDALPLCNAICCRMKAGYSIELEADELDSYKARPAPGKPGTLILQTAEDGLSCVYLNKETSTCTIHGRAPKMCRRWHCSPQGKKDDGEIDVRDAGWVFIPLRKQEAALIHIQLAGGN